MNSGEKTFVAAVFVIATIIFGGLFASQAYSYRQGKEIAQACLAAGKEFNWRTWGCLVPRETTSTSTLAVPIPTQETP